MSLGNAYSPIVPVGGTTIYKLLPVPTHSNGYMEVYRRFQEDILVGGGVEKRRICLGTFHGGICHGEENFHEGCAGFSSIIKKNNEKINVKVFSIESKELY